MSYGIISTGNLEDMRNQGYADDDIAETMANSSEGFRNQLTRIRNASKNDPLATTAFLNYRFFGDAQYKRGTPQKKGYVGRTLDRIYKDVNDIRAAKARSAYRTESGEGSFSPKVDEMLQIAPNIGSILLSPATQLSEDVVGGIFRAFGVDELIASTVKEIQQSDIYKDLSPSVKKVVDVIKKSDPDAIRSLAALGEYGLDALDVYGTTKGVQLGYKGIKNVGKSVTSHPIKSVRHPIQALKGTLDDTVKAPLRSTADDLLSRPELIGKAKEAVSKGVDEPTVRLIAEQNQATRKAMAEMTKVAAKDSGKAGGSYAHKEILGKYVLGNVDNLLQERGRVGRVLGALKSSRADDVVDLTDEYFAFMAKLNDLGATFDDSGRVITSLASTSDDNIKILQKALNFYSPDDAGNVIKTFKQADQWRSKMFKEMKAAKAKLAPSSAGQSVFDDGERIVNALRRATLEKMSNGDDFFLAVNDSYEDIVTETSKFLKSIGYKGKLDAESILAKDLRAGEVTLRSLGNAAGDRRDALRDIIAAARRHGFQSEIDYEALIRYTDRLEDIFPISPARSLRGEVSRATRDAAGNLIEDVVTSGPKSATVRAALGKVTDKIDIFRGMTPENRLKLLLEILEAPPETPLISIVDDFVPEESIDDVSKQVRGVNAGDIQKGAINKLGNVDDTPLSQLSPNDPGINDAVRAQKILDEGGDITDAVKISGGSPSS